MQKIIWIIILILFLSDSRLSAGERKSPVPDKSALTAASKLVDDVFKDDCEKAKNDATLKKLAKDIFQKAVESTDGLAIQFAL